MSNSCFGPFDCDAQRMRNFERVAKLGGVLFGLEIPR